MTRRLVVLGAGGHARASLDVLLADDGYEVVGCVAGSDEGRLQVPLLGDESALEGLWKDGVRHAFVAIGDNRSRRRVVGDLRRAGWQLPWFAAASSVRSRMATVGEGSLLMPGSVVNSYAVIGTAVIVNTGATVDHDCCLGDFVHIAPGAHIAGGVSLQEGVFMGIGAVAVPGVDVGAWATVGAGGVVVRDVAANAVAKGVPARSRGTGAQA